MVFLAFFLLCCFPIATSLIFKNYNKKQNNFLVVAVIFGLIQFISFFFINNQFNSLITMMVYEQFSIAVWILVVLIALAYWLFFFLSLKKINFNKAKLKENIIYSFKRNIITSISFLIVGVCLLFVNTNFTDTTAYVTLSERYQNNLFLSFDGINPIGNEYKISMMYYVYPVLFFDNVASGYNFFNPILLNLIWLVIINDLIWKEKDSYNLKNFYLPNAIINFLLISAFYFISYFQTGGNLFFQTSILLMIFAIYKINKNINYLIMPAIMLQFFSPTGIVITILSGLSILIFVLLSKNIRSFIIAFFLVIFSLSFSPFLLNDFLQTNINTLAISLTSVCVLFISVIGFLMVNFLLKNKHNKFLDFHILNSKTINSNAMFTTSIFIAFIIFSFNFIFYGFSYQMKYLYNAQLVYFYMIIYFFISLAFFVNWKKAKLIKKDYLMMLVFSLSAMLFGLLIILSKTSNSSIWRSIYFNVGMGGPIDIILLCYVLSVPLFCKLKLLLIRPNFNFKINDILLSIALLGYTISFSFIMTTGILPTKINFNSNIEYNLNNVTKQDIDYLKQMALTNTSTIFSDTRSFNYLQNGQNWTNVYFSFSNSIYLNANPIASTHLIESYNLLGTIEFYNSNNKNQLSTNVNDLSNNLLLMLNSIPFNFDYFILDNASLYYNDFTKNILNYKIGYSTKYIGNYLTVIGL